MWPMVTNFITAEYIQINGTVILSWLRHCMLSYQMHGSLVIFYLFMNIFWQSYHKDTTKIWGLD